jgi:pimeloyl-ACP methyl ester carboxylesterase
MIRSILLLLMCAGCGADQPATVMRLSAPPRAYLLHLPGIGGEMRIDRNLIAGLEDGGVDADMQIYDWTGSDRGLLALGNTTRHSEQAADVAAMIAQARKLDPSRRIIVTAHSAGCGVAVWALERLPDDVLIDSLLLMQSALSPEYDLSRALRHVHGHAYAFYSRHDPVLALGTKMLGTVDRVNTEASGNVGFIQPAGADHLQYAKLRQFEYQDAWMRFGDSGDHIGPMRRIFARDMLAPLLKTGELPELSNAPVAGSTNN